MSAIALVLAKRGFSISGSDKNQNNAIQNLSRNNVRIFAEQRKRNIDFLYKAVNKKLIIIISSAIPNDNEELTEAKAKNLKIIHRSDILNYLTQKQPSILIAGSHGKTTTSTIITTLLDLCKQDPTAIIGGEVPLYQSNGHAGQGKYLVAEADESDGTIIKFKADIGVITNLELDHTDFYKDIKSIQATMKIFSKRSRILIANYDSNELKNFLTPQTIWYSIKTKSNVKYAALPKEVNGNHTIARYYENEKFRQTLKIPLPGLHNLSNVLSAISVLREIGISISELSKYIEFVNAPRRRFDFKGTWEGKQIVDDYAHHPTEIKATINMARLMINNTKSILPKKAKRLVVIFQPHRYSRTKAMIQEFAESLINADLVILLPIYSAGEEPIDGVNSKVLASLIKEKYPNKITKVVNNFTYLKDKLRELNHPDDLILFLGAGNISNFANKLIIENQNIISPSE